MEDTIVLTSWSPSSSPPPTAREAHKFDKFSHQPRILQAIEWTWRDIKLVTKYCIRHQRKLWFHVGLFLFSSFAFVSSLVFLGAGDNFGTAAVGQYCSPGGDFNFNQTYNPWASEHTFQVTLGIGNMTFAQAKAIDVVWDVTMGRGGQFLLAMVCYYVYSKALNRILEQPEASVSYDAFRAIVFEEPSLRSTLKLVRDITLVKGWRTKAIIIWIVTSSLYVVAFPTMVSAMTGYSTNVKPYLNRNSTKTLVLDDYLHRAIYRVHGADRINGLNLSSTYLVGSRGFGSSRKIEQDYVLCVSNQFRHFVISDFLDDDCALAYAVTVYANGHANGSSANVTSYLIAQGGATLSVDPPTLTIETLHTSTDYDGERWDFPNAAEGVGSSAIPLYTTTDNDGEAYNATYLNTLGTCDSQATYMWGFSFILLFAFLVITGFWVLGMYAMWCDTFWNCKLDRAGRTLGFYRGVVDLSNAMWSDTLRHPAGMASESEIRSLMMEKLNGGRLKFDEVHADDLPPSRMDDWKQFKRGMPFLHGWTKTWTLMHWSWLGIFLGGCFAWMFIPISIILGNSGMIKFANLFSLAVAGVSWSSTLFLLICTAPGLARWCRRTPFIGTRVNPRTRRYWVWTAASAVIGFFGFYVTVSIPFLINPRATPTEIEPHFYLLPLDQATQDNMLNSVIIIDISIAPIFFLFAIITSMIGILSTICRWCAWCFRLGRRRSPLTQNALYSIQSTSDTAESTSPRVGSEDGTERRESVVHSRSV